jgi:ATP phosphoribosyltransferase
MEAQVGITRIRCDGRVWPKPDHPSALTLPPFGQIYALTSFLRAHGAEAVAVADLDYVFSRDNPLYAKLEAGL